METLSLQRRARPEPRATGEVLAERGSTAALIAVAAAVMLLHMLANGRYGFHPDELDFLSNARHLDWGFVEDPPLLPFLERIGLEMFGLSLVGLRLFSVLAQAAAIVLTGLMARELGGRRLAQVTAALAVALSGLTLFEGSVFQYTSLDYLWWVLIAYFMILLLKTENSRWWMAIGATAGIGMLTKYTMAFLVAGIVGGMLLTKARRYFASGWFWAGIGIGLLIFLPNFLWQVRHDFTSLHFLEYIHVRDVRLGRTDGFWRDQLLLWNPLALPLWVAGLLALLRSERYRLVAWMYLIPLAIFVVAKGRGYYLGPAYPMLIAMGAVVGEVWVGSLTPLRARAVKVGFFAGLAICGAYLCVLEVPLAGSGPLRDFELRHNGAFRREIGWNELVRTVAAIRDSLPAEQRGNVGVLVATYGEQGAIEMLGPAYHLPSPISGTNSGWLRSYPASSPSALIVIGWPPEYAERMFTSCYLAGHNVNSYGIQNEETLQNPDIFVCAAPRLPWPEFWKEYQNFG
jgi:MFS family permease